MNYNKKNFFLLFSKIESIYLPPSVEFGHGETINKTVKIFWANLYRSHKEYRSQWILIFITTLNFVSEKNCYSVFIFWDVDRQQLNIRFSVCETGTLIFSWTAFTAQSLEFSGSFSNPIFHSHHGPDFSQPATVSINGG